MYEDAYTDQWFQIGTVQGGVKDCGDKDFPGLFIRLDDPDVHNFIHTVLKLKGNN